MRDQIKEEANIRTTISICTLERIYAPTPVYSNTRTDSRSLPHKLSCPITTAPGGLGMWLYVCMCTGV